MAVTISGMFGSGNTYFADSPVVITVSGLEWGTPVTSPFTIVRVKVLYNGTAVGEFRADTGGQTSISFDISSALRAIWSDYTFSTEVAAAQNQTSASRRFRSYSLKVYTEYLDSTDGEYTTTESDEITGGQCAIGHLTEWERSAVSSDEAADASYWENTNPRNGDASTKPRTSPERVGSTSITSWTDVSNEGTQSVFYPPTAASGKGSADSYGVHPPLVLRDSQPYTDFLFLNRRGAVETCSALTMEAMSITAETQKYSLTKRPSFRPTRSLTAIGTDGRRSWQMSSGPVTREWAEWWITEFLGGRRKQWWMLWQGPGLDTPRYVPVIVEPAKKQTSVYDRARQQMPHVDFTVTLALEG